MKFAIGGAIILIVLFLTGFFLKKKHYKEVDRLEEWKMDITNHPVLDEMSKVKQLNMTGQTEELFERWRNDWDEIVAVRLPNVEEYLFDAEEYIDKYRFRKASSVQQEIDKYLSDIEADIKIMLTELNELVGSEEKNRKEIEDLKDVYRESKKTLLAHHHTYGKAAEQIEQQLDEAFAKFDEFMESTGNGNYLEAREVVFTIQANLDDIHLKMELIPTLLVECQSKIPSQLKELTEGFKEMSEQGFILDHIQLEKEKEKIEKDIAIYLDKIKNADISDVEKGINDIHESIDLLYDLFENEVHSRHYINKVDEAVETLLMANKEANKQLKDELELVSESYHLSEKDAQTQAQLEKKLAQLVNQFDILEHKIVVGETAYSLIKEELDEIKVQLEEITLEHKAFSEKLQALRKDEIFAHEKIGELKKKIVDTIKLVAKSNVPGLPQDYLYLLEDAKESVSNVILKLEEKPLNIQTVQQYLEVAELTVDKIIQIANEMIETIMLVERVIQYGNRYRSRYPSIEVGLLEAEAAFRGFDYKAALEHAATAIEEIEPGAIKKIENLINELHEEE